VTQTPDYELPADKQREHARAVRLEWITIGYLISAIVFIYLTLGSSQAMKTAWFEDMLSLLPPIAFLVASRVRKKRPDRDHPYGWHRAVSIAYLVASLALLLMGAFLLFDAISKLLSFEHPSIGVVTLAGREIWLGWLMIAALVYSAVPAAFLGRMKLPIASSLHDKVLFADAKMNKADWLTATAAILGVLGISVGFWWADAVAAGVISTDILHDGVTNIRRALSDLMDSAPMRVDGEGRDGLPTRIETEMKTLPWVADARARMREEGHVYYGEIFVIPRSDDAITRQALEAAGDMLRQLDWRIHDVVVTPVSAFEERP
jgi:cation diffusion facilitator family transporter